MSDPFATDDPREFQARVREWFDQNAPVEGRRRRLLLRGTS